MSYALHQTDEETDTGAYRAYLRAQPEMDLLDIVHHLDPDRYPARLDAAQRELRRRQVLHGPLYTSFEYTVRYFAVLAFALSGLTLALSLLSAAGSDVTGLNLSGTMLKDGMHVSRIILMLLTVSLHLIVAVAVRIGLYPITLGFLGWWTVSRILPVRRHQARSDVWRLALLSLLALSLVTCMASSPFSALPELLSPDGVRPFTLLNPFTPL